MTVILSSLLAQQTWRSPVVLEATQRVRVMVMALSAYIVLIECPRLIQGKGVAGKKTSKTMFYKLPAAKLGHIKKVQKYRKFYDNGK